MLDILAVGLKSYTNYYTINHIYYLTYT